MWFGTNYMENWKGVQLVHIVAKQENILITAGPLKMQKCGISLKGMNAIQNNWKNKVSQW